MEKGCLRLVDPGSEVGCWTRRRCEEAGAVGEALVHAAVAVVGVELVLDLHDVVLQLLLQRVVHLLWGGGRRAGFAGNGRRRRGGVQGPPPPLHMVGEGSDHIWCGSVCSHSITRINRATLALTVRINLLYHHSTCELCVHLGAQTSGGRTFVW